MKILAKVVFVAIAAGGVATMYAAPGLLGSASNYASEASAIKTQIIGDHQYVLRLKAGAMREKDIIKLNCLNDKLVQMLPEMNIVDSLISRLNASTGGEQEVIYRDLQSSANKVREQRELATQCAESKLIVTESRNSFTGPSGGENPWDPNSGGGNYIEPPAYASSPGR